MGSDVSPMSSHPGQRPQAHCQLVALLSTVHVPMHCQTYLYQQVLTIHLYPAANMLYVPALAWMKCNGLIPRGLGIVWLT